MKSNINGSKDIYNITVNFNTLLIVLLEASTDGIFFNKRHYYLKLLVWNIQVVLELLSASQCLTNSREHYLSVDSCHKTNPRIIEIRIRCIQLNGFILTFILLTILVFTKIDMFPKFEHNK